MAHVKDRVHRADRGLHLIRSALWAGVVVSFVLIGLAAAGYA